MRWGSTTSLPPVPRRHSVKPLSAEGRALEDDDHGKNDTRDGTGVITAAMTPGFAFAVYLNPMRCSEIFDKRFRASLCPQDERRVKFWSADSVQLAFASHVPHKRVIPARARTCPSHPCHGRAPTASERHQHPFLVDALCTRYVRERDHRSPSHHTLSKPQRRVPIRIRPRALQRPHTTRSARGTRASARPPRRRLRRAVVQSRRPPRKRGGRRASAVRVAKSRDDSIDRFRHLTASVHSKRGRPLAGVCRLVRPLRCSLLKPLQTALALRCGLLSSLPNARLRPPPIRQSTQTRKEGCKNAHIAWSRDK